MDCYYLLTSYLHTNNIVPFFRVLEKGSIFSLHRHFSVILFKNRCEQKGEGSAQQRKAWRRDGLKRANETLHSLTRHTAPNGCITRFCSSHSELSELSLSTNNSYNSISGTYQVGIRQRSRAYSIGAQFGMYNLCRTGRIYSTYP